MITRQSRNLLVGRGWRPISAAGRPVAAERKASILNEDSCWLTVRPQSGRAAQTPAQLGECEGSSTASLPARQQSGRGRILQHCGSIAEFGGVLRTSEQLPVGFPRPTAGASCATVDFQYFDSAAQQNIAARDYAVLACPVTKSVTKGAVLEVLAHRKNCGGVNRPRCSEMTATK